RGIHKPLNQTPDAFGIGSLHHAGRARWFSLRFATDDSAWASIRQAVDEEAERQKLPVSVKARQQALAYLDEYVNHWSKRPRPSPIATEYKVGPAPLQPDDPFFLWRTARLDDV